MTRQRQCVLCRQPTIGSVGAAGFIWRTICQTCKDSGDKALAERLQRYVDARRKIINLLGGINDG